MATDPKDPTVFEVGFDVSEASSAQAQADVAAAAKRQADAANAAAAKAEAGSKKRQSASERAAIALERENKALREQIRLLGLSRAEQGGAQRAGDVGRSRSEAIRSGKADIDGLKEQLRLREQLTAELGRQVTLARQLAAAQREAFNIQRRGTARVAVASQLPLAAQARQAFGGAIGARQLARLQADVNAGILTFDQANAIALGEAGVYTPRRQGATTRSRQTADAEARLETQAGNRNLAARTDRLRAAERERERAHQKELNRLAAEEAATERLLQKNLALRTARGAARFSSQERILSQQAVGVFGSSLPAGQLRALQRDIRTGNLTFEEANAIANQGVSLSAARAAERQGQRRTAQPRTFLQRAQQRFGGDYETYAKGARAAGIAVEEFARKKLGALNIEERNEQQLKKLNAANKATERGFLGLGAGATQVVRVLRSLATAFIGFQLFRAVQHGLSDMIEFQKTLQNVRLGVAEVLLVGNQFRNQVTGEVLPVAEAVRAAFSLASRASRDLVEESIRLGLPLDNLVQSYQTVAGLAASANVSQTKTIQIITQIGTVAQRLNIPFNQLTRSIDNIFTGLRVQQTQLGVVLGLNQQIVQEQIRQGTLGDFLLSRLQGVAETLPENLKTFEGISQSVRSIVLDLSQRIGGTTFELLQDSLTNIRNQLEGLRKDPNFIAETAKSMRDAAEAALAFARGIAETVRQFGPLIKILGGAALGQYLGGRVGAGFGAAVGGGLIGSGAGLAGILGGAALGAAGPTLLGQGTSRIAKLVTQLNASGAAQFGGASGIQLALRQGISPSAAAAAFGGGAVPAASAAAGTGAVTGLIAAARAALTAAGGLGGLASAVLPLGALLGGFGLAIRAATTELNRVTPNRNPTSARFSETTSERRDRLRAEAEAAFGRAEEILGRYGENRPDLAQGAAISDRDIGTIRLGTRRGPAQLFRAEAIGQLKELETIFGENSPVQAFLDDLATFGETQAGELPKLKSKFDQLSSLYLGIERRSNVEQILRALDDSLKVLDKENRVSRERLEKAKAEKELNEAALQAEIASVQIRQRILDERQRRVELRGELANARAGLDFTRGPGAAASSARIRQQQLQSQLGVIESEVGLAEQAGNFGRVEALLRERLGVERELLETRRELQQSEVAAAESARDAAGRRVAQEQEINNFLPERIRLEARVLELQEQQARVRAAGAAAEEELASQQASRISSRLVELNLREASAKGDPQYSAEAFEQRRLDLQSRLFDAEQQVLQARTRGAVAASEIAQAQANQDLQSIRNGNLRLEREVAITNAVQGQEEAGQQVREQQAALADFDQQRNQQAKEHLKYVQDLARQWDTVRSDTAQYLSDLLQGNDALEAGQNLIKRLLNQSVDEVANIITGRQVSGKTPAGSLFGSLFGGLLGGAGGGGSAPSLGGGGGGGGTGQIARIAQNLGGLYDTAAGGLKAIGVNIPSGGSLFNSVSKFGGGALSTIANYVGLEKVASLLGLGGGATAGATGGIGAVGGLSATGNFAVSGAPILADVYGTAFAGGANAAGASGAALGTGAASSAAGAIGGGAVSALAAVATLTTGLLAAGRAERFARNNPRYNANDIAGQSVGAFSSSISGLPLGGIAKQGPAGQIAAGAIGGAVSGALIGGAALGGVGIILGAIIAAILIAVSQQKTAGSLIARALVPALKDIGFTRDVRFGGTGYARIATNLNTSGGNSLTAPLPTNYAPLLDRGIAAGLSARSTHYYNLGRGDVLAGLPRGVQAAVLGTSAGLGLGPEDALGALRDFTETTAGDYTKGGYKILARYRGRDPRVKLSRDQTQQALGALVAAFADFPIAIDEARLAMVAFGRDGQISLKALERAAQDAKTVIAEGVPSAFAESIRSGQPIEAATALADNFAQTFTNRVAQQIITSGAIGAALTEAVALANQAAEALVAGDEATANDLLTQARSAFITGRNDALSVFGRLFGPVTGFNASIGVFPGGSGLVNPTGAGLPSFQTNEYVRNPGPPGRPMLSVTHGDERIRTGASEDGLTAAVQTLVSAQREVLTHLRRQPGGGVELRAYLDGEEIASRLEAKSRRNGAAGSGIVVPQANLGVA